MYAYDIPIINETLNGTYAEESTILTKYQDFIKASPIHLHKLHDWRNLWIIRLPALQYILKTPQLLRHHTLPYIYA